VNKAAEQKALADAERHAKEFCLKNGISRQEWERAAQMAADLQNDLLNSFWEVYRQQRI
jgi:hypothetical protein